MGFNSAFKGLKLLKKKPGNGRLNNLNHPSRPQCVKAAVIPFFISIIVMGSFTRRRNRKNYIQLLNKLRHHASAWCPLVSRLQFIPGHKVL